MILNNRIRGFLLQLIKPSANIKEIQKAERALRIIERGRIFESELSWLSMIGYKPQ